MNQLVIGPIIGGILVLIGCMVGCEIRDKKYSYKSEKVVRGIGGSTVSKEYSYTRYPEIETPETTELPRP